MKSNCCQAKIKNINSSGGTGFMSCTGCGKGCDVYVEEKKSEGWEERFDDLKASYLGGLIGETGKNKPRMVRQFITTRLGIPGTVVVKQFIQNERREAKREMGESLRMEEKMLEYHRNKAKNVKSIRAKNYHRSMLMAYGEFNKTIDKYLETYEH